MSEKYQGSQLSKDVREVTDLTPVQPIPPTFATRNEWEGFQQAVVRAFEQGLLPDSIDNAKKAIVLASKGRELNMEPLYALSVLYLVHGKPALEGEAMLGLTMRRYPNAKLEWVEQTHQKAELRMARPGGNYSTFSFTVEDAVRAEILEKINPDGTVRAATNKYGKRNTVWEKYTKDMLMWRAVARAIRFLFPECIQGCLTPDEVDTLTTEGPVKSTVKDLDSQFAPPQVEAPTPKPALQAAKTIADLDTEIIAPAPHKATPPKVIVAEKVVASEPVEKFPFEVENYVFPAGLYTGKRMSDLNKSELQEYVKNLRKRDAHVQGRDAVVKEMLSNIEAYLGET